MRKILMTGNEACGEGAIKAGCRFYAGYPITPQNELTAYMSKRMDEVGGVFIQSESEIAAINMVFGAACTGQRAMTTSSSPGISLMQEAISYIAGCQLPCVIVNVMRGGPGLGNIAPAQADYFQATKGGGHGDYSMVVLAPSNAQEMFDHTVDAFDIADRYRSPVMILSDGMIGQMMEPMIVREEGRSAPAADRDWVLQGAKGREPRIVRSFFINDGALESWNNQLQKKFKDMAANELRFTEYGTKDADIVFIAYGSMARICEAVCDRLRGAKIKAGLLRPVTLWPFPYKEIKKLDTGRTRFMVVEMSAGQMLFDVRLAVQDDPRVHFYGRMGGGIPSEEEILAAARSLGVKSKGKVGMKKAKRKSR